MRRRLPQTHSRSGFSLIELLVAMAIIAILCGMAWTMLGTTGTSAKIAATRTTLSKIGSMLSARQREFSDLVEKQDQKKSLGRDYMSIYGNAQVVPTLYPTFSGVSPGVAATIVKNARYVALFPQREQDLFGLNGTRDTPTWIDDSPLLPAWDAAKTGPGTHTPDTESSELLYLMLTAEVRGLGTSRGPNLQILDSIQPRHIGDTDNDGRKEFLDDFGKPLRFYNAPTRLVRPGGLGTAVNSSQLALTATLISGVPRLPVSASDFTSSFNQDSLDQRGTLRQTDPILNPTYAAGNLAARNSFEDMFHTPDTYWVPLVMSCGPDEVLGLGEPTLATAQRLAGYDTDGDGVTTSQADKDAADAATDNLTQVQQRGR